MSEERGGRDGRTRDDPEPPKEPPPDERRREQEERDRDDQLKESFPSSDPPGEGGPGV
jgi:hypothetical protein